MIHQVPATFDNGVIIDRKFRFLVLKLIGSRVNGLILIEYTVHIILPVQMIVW